MRKFFLILVILLFSLLTSCHTFNNETRETDVSSERQETDVSKETVEDNSMKICAIYVNKNEIESVGVYNDEDLFELPIVSVLKALGATVTWRTSQEVSILYDDTEYILSTVDKTIYNDGEVVLLSPPGGGFDPVFRVSGEEVFIDNLTLEYFLEYEVGAFIAWNHDTKEVHIHTKPRDEHRDREVIRINGERSGFFGAIFLTYETNDRENPEDVVRHEYGHKVQFDNMGVVDYTQNVAIPSVTAYKLDCKKKLPFDYYSSPWEAGADSFGGVKRAPFNNPWTPQHGYYDVGDLAKVIFMQ